MVGASKFLGITGIGEAIYGVDILTFEELSEAERWNRFAEGIAGASSVVGTGAGVLKGVTAFAKPRTVPVGRQLLDVVNELEFPFKPSNFRKNLEKLWQVDGSPIGYDAHHVFPRNLLDDFKKHVPDIDIDDPAFGAWWEESAHRSASKAYEAAWKEFLQADRRTLDEIIDFGNELAGEYGFDWSY